MILYIMVSIIIWATYILVGVDTAILVTLTAIFTRMMEKRVEDE